MMKNKIVNNKADQSLETWKAIKKKYIDAIILIRSGDDYLTFGRDAETIGNISPVRTTTHSNMQSQCKFHFSQLDLILSRLVKAGHRVAVCDQL